MPITEQDWLTVERGFHNRFPHAIGAIDGKHVVLQAPFNTGSEYYNYKKTFSIVLLALVDSNYCFMFADIGCQGRISDGGVLKNSILWNKMENNLLRLPAPNPLTNGNIDLPYVFLGDGAFALHKTLMKPYPGEQLVDTKERIFNRKLSSARAIVENTFGVMSSVFRVLRKPLLLQPEQAKKIVMACVVLHNFLRLSRYSSSTYTPPGTFDTYSGDTLISNGSWRDNVPNNPALRNMRRVPRRSEKTAVKIRNAFANHFHHSLNNVT